MSVVALCCPVALWRGGEVVGMAYVDGEDAERVGEHRWHPHPNGYAETKINGRTVLLHRFVMGLAHGDGREIDHENRDRLDCTRGNMRVVTHAANLQNRSALGGSSRFRGVSWYRQTRRWQAQVCVGGRRIKVGYRLDEVEAALLAHEARCRLMPFATPDPELVKLGLA